MIGLEIPEEGQVVMRVQNHPKYREMMQKVYRLEAEVAAAQQGNQEKDETIAALQEKLKNKAKATVAKRRKDKHPTRKGWKPPAPVRTEEPTSGQKRLEAEENAEFDGN